MAIGASLWGAYNQIGRIRPYIFQSRDGSEANMDTAA